MLSRFSRLTKAKAPVFARAFHAGVPTLATEPAACDPDKSPIKDNFVERYDLDHWSRSLPIGFFGASWLIGGGYYTVNEETMLAISGTMFAIVLYDAASGAVSEMLDARAKEIETAHNELEDAQIAKLDALLDVYRAEVNMVEDTEAQIADTVALAEGLIEANKLKWKHETRNMVVSQLDSLVTLRESTIQGNLAGTYERISGHVASRIETEGNVHDDAITDAISVLEGIASGAGKNESSLVRDMYMDAVLANWEGVNAKVASGEKDLTKLSAEERAELQAMVDAYVSRDPGGAEIVAAGETKLPDKIKYDLSLF